MPLSGIRQIRQLFSDQLPQGWTLLDARMSLQKRDDGPGQWQLLTFRVIDPHGQEHMVGSGPVPAKDDCYALATKVGEQFREGLKNEPPHGVDETHGGERPDDREVPSSDGGELGGVSRPSGVDEAGSDGVSRTGSTATS